MVERCDWRRRDYLAELDCSAEAITSLQTAWSIVRSTADRWYVYVLWRLDLYRPIPFYVGKGRKYRFTHHEMRSELPLNPHKRRIIERHEKLGLKIGYSIHAYDLDEQDALDAEAALIEKLGRRNRNLGPLTNLTNGGEGTSGHLGLRGDTNPKSRAVFANGRRYAWMGAAAATLDIEPSALSHRIKNGWPGYYYEDEGQRPARVRLLERYRRAVVAEGGQYPSLSDASRATGIDVRQIYKRIHYGWPGYAYQGETPRPRREKGRTDHVQAVVIDQARYPSVAKAARARGESASKIRTRCKSSNYPDYRYADSSKTKISKGTPPKTPFAILVEEKRYSSCGEAARACGMTGCGVQFRCASSNYPDWRYEDDERQSAAHVDAQFSSNPKLITIDGETYSSQSGAARVLGIDINTLKKRCMSEAFPLYVSYDPALKKRPPKDGRPGLLAIEVDNEAYRSVNAAAKALGIARHEIRRRCDDGAWPSYRLLN